jgi:hypothetical protein
MLVGDVHFHQTQPNFGRRNVDLTGYVVTRDGVIVGFELSGRSGGESLAF